LLCSIGADGVGVYRLRRRLRGGLRVLTGLRIEKSAGRVGKLVGWKRLGDAGSFVGRTGAASEFLSAESQRCPGGDDPKSGAEHQAGPPETGDRIKGHTVKTHPSQIRL